MAASFVTSEQGGAAHVRSHHFAQLFASIVGTGSYVMDGFGRGLEAYMATSNTLHAESGLMLLQGREVSVDTDGLDWTVQNGTQGQQRVDVACMRYAKDPSTGVESIAPVVVKGAPAASDPVPPTIPACDLTSGDAAEGLVPVFRVRLDGTVPGKPELLLGRVDPIVVALAKYLPRSGGTLDGTLVLAKRNGVEGSAYNGPALVVGGTPDDPHLELDGNEVQAKADRSTPAKLAINDGGGDVSFGGAILPKTPLALARGGTGSTTAAAARAALGITLANIGAAAASHKHSAADVNAGILPIEYGGTGGGTAATARSKLGITPANIGAAASSHNHSAANITSGTLPIARGGTGATTSGGLGLHAYPVGAVYISFVSTSPASLFGGAWTAITGRFPYFNASTATGGSNTHALTVAQMPKHGHKSSLKGNGSTVSGGHEWGYGSKNSGYGGSNTADSYIETTGGGAAHNNMPAYQTLYAWRRTG